VGERARMWVTKGGADRKGINTIDQSEAVSGDYVRRCNGMIFRWETRYETKGGRGMPKNGGERGVSEMSENPPTN
jgi:hypothetical protein